MHIPRSKTLFIAGGIGSKFGNQCLKQICKFCHETLRAQFYDQTFYEESKIVKENLKSILLDIFSKFIIFFKFNTL